MRDHFLDVIDMEIGFHSDVTNPWYWRWVCKIFNKKECHAAVVCELTNLKHLLEIDQHFRNCADCGIEYEPIDTFDWWCKKCLTKRFNDCRKFGIDYQNILKDEPEMTTSGPGGS